MYFTHRTLVLAAVALAPAVGVNIIRIGPVSVDLITVGQDVTVSVSDARIGPDIELREVGQAVRIAVRQGVPDQGREPT